MPKLRPALVRQAELLRALRGDRVARPAYFPDREQACARGALVASIGARGGHRLAEIQDKPQPTSAREGASGFSRLIFFALAFGMAYWFTKTDDFDLITFIRSAIESNLASLLRVQDRREAGGDNSGAACLFRTRGPATGSRDLHDSPHREPASAPDGRQPTVGTARPGPPPEIEGLTSAQVARVLGAPNRQVAGGDGVASGSIRTARSLCISTKTEHRSSRRDECR